MIGGRLVAPVELPGLDQQLVRVTRVSADHYDQQLLGRVAFVPLVEDDGAPMPL